MDNNKVLDENSQVVDPCQLDIFSENYSFVHEKIGGDRGIENNGELNLSLKAGAYINHDYFFLWSSIAF